MHSESRHADVDLVAGGTLLGQLRVRTAVRLLVTGEIGGGGVVLATLSARVTGALLGLGGRGHHTAAVDVALARATVADEEGVVGVADGDVLLATTATSLRHAHLAVVRLRVVVVLRGGEDRQIVIGVLLVLRERRHRVLILVAVVVDIGSTHSAASLVVALTVGRLEQVVATLLVAQVEEVAITRVDGVACRDRSVLAALLQLHGTSIARRVSCGWQEKRTA